MTRAARASALLFAAGLLAGSLAPPPPPAPVRRTPGGEQVLEGDFHVHAGLGDGALPPWSLLQEARRNGLDVVAVTNHNQTFAARAARFFARLVPDAPIVLVGQEVTASGFHMVAAGVETAVDWRLGAAEAVAAIHAQGGRAIAAHPVSHYWGGLDAALGSLDGAEVWHPLVFAEPARRAELHAFQARLQAAGRPRAAIGSSDYHVMTALGLTRTYVFVREASAAGVLEALGTGRTVVLDDQGGAWGDPERARFLRDAGAAERSAARLRRTPAERAAAMLAWLGMLGLVTLRRDSTQEDA